MWQHGASRSLRTLGGSPKTSLRDKGEMNILALKQVKSGDLITAELLNQMIVEINRLSKAVSVLERKRSFALAHGKETAN
jgi:hypothetical protein